MRAVWRRGKREDHFFPFFVMVMEVGEPGFGEVEDFAMLLIMTSAPRRGGELREQAVAVTICREKGEWDGAEGRVRRRAGRRRGWQRRRVGPHAAGRAAVVRGGGVRIFLLCRSVCDVCARRTLCTPRVAAGCRKRAVAGWAMRRAAPTAGGGGTRAPQRMSSLHILSATCKSAFFLRRCCGC